MSCPVKLSHFLPHAETRKEKKRNEVLKDTCQLLLISLNNTEVRSEPKQWGNFFHSFHFSSNDFLNVHLRPMYVSCHESVNFQRNVLGYLGPEISKLKKISATEKK